MAETIKPKDLSPNFLKKIEDKYGPTSSDDFFSADLDTYYKADDPSERGEGGGITHTIIKLPSFAELFKDLDQAKDSAKALSRNPELRGDTEFAQQAGRDGSMVKAAVQEISTSGAAGGFLTKYAFGKAPNYYTKVLGYKPVNQKALRKKSKGFDYVDLYKK
jgi:hypothetical protein